MDTETTQLKPTGDGLRKDLLTEDLLRRFRYHAPFPGQPEQYERIRNKALELALLIAIEAPDCRERSTAFTKVEEAVMWTNAGIARHGLSPSAAIP